MITESSIEAMPGEGGLGLGTSASAVLSAALPVVPILVWHSYVLRECWLIILFLDSPGRYR